MNVVFKNSLGEITVSPRILADIAAKVASKCYGVVGMASKSSKSVTVLKSDNLNKGVHITVGENGILIELHIVVQFGLNINSTCESIVHRVRYTLEGKMGLPVKCINIKVDGVRVSE